MTTTDREFVYPPEFVERVKTAFPNDAGLHDMLDRNSTRVGGSLDIKCRGDAAASPDCAAAGSLFAQWRQLMFEAGLRDSAD